MSENRVIGKDNKIPWHISEDFKRFKEITRGHPVIMGRKTWESLPIKPLPGRYNIVITRDLGFKINDLREGKNFIVVSSLEEALKVAKGVEREEIFIIGGGQIFQQAISIADKLYLTIVEGNFEGDAFFPDYSDFKKVVFEQEGKSEGYKYKFLELEK